MSELLAKDLKYIWHPFTQHQTSKPPVVILKAKDEFLIDERGKEYIDANSSWWVNVHGHGHPHIQKAIAEQFMSLDHVVFAGLTHPKAIELSERIIGLLPDNFNKVFFSDNGSTSVEVALKMAFQYWYNKGFRKKRVMAIEGAYHGDTFGAMSVGERDLFNRPFEDFFFDVDFIPFPSKERESEILDEADRLFATDEFASLIVEPLIQGSSGMRIYTVEFLDKLVSIARKRDVLVIFDEVMTGFGRTGKLFAMDHCEVKPDIVTLSKGLTGGVLPLGLTVADNNLFDAFLSEEKARGFLHGHSYTGNPLACAAACASLDLFGTDQTNERINNLCDWNMTFAKELKGFPKAKNVRTMGTILAFEIDSGGNDSYFAEIREMAYAHFIENGVLIRPLGNTVFINPPYCINHLSYKLLKEVILDLLKSV